MSIAINRLPNKSLCKIEEFLGDEKEKLPLVNKAFYYRAQALKNTTLADFAKMQAPIRILSPYERKLAPLHLQVFQFLSAKQIVQMARCSKNLQKVVKRLNKACKEKLIALSQTQGLEKLGKVSPNFRNIDAFQRVALNLYKKENRAPCFTFSSRIDELSLIHLETSTQSKETSLETFWEKWMYPEISSHGKKLLSDAQKDRDYEFLQLLKTNDAPPKDAKAKDIERFLNDQSNLLSTAFSTRLRLKKKLVLDSIPTNSIPPFIFKELSQLTELDAKGCGLKILPKEIALCKRLKVLRLENNPLTVLPDVFDKFPHLIGIDVDNNDLRSLPPSFGKLRKCRIFLKNNRNLSVSEEQIDQLLKNGCTIFSTNLSKKFPQVKEDWSIPEMPPVPNVSECLIS